MKDAAAEVVADRVGMTYEGGHVAVADASLNASRPDRRRS